MRTSRALLLAAVVAAAGQSCRSDHGRAEEVVGPRNLKPLTEAGSLVLQRTIYVPIYSSLHASEKQPPIDLSATLSLRNISEHTPVVLTAVEYFDSDGGLVRSFLEQPAELGPLMTAEFFIARSDRSGGSGANFLVRWGLREPGPNLLVEAVMRGRDGSDSISFLTEGRVVATETPPAKPP